MKCDHLVNSRATALAFVVFAHSVAFTVGVAAQNVASPPDVILLSLDTVRNDALAEAKKKSPFWDYLIGRSANFSGAMTSSPLTLPAHTSLLSGLNPNRHGVRNNGHRVGKQFPLLAETLKVQGYATAAVVSAYPLAKQFGLHRGFDGYDEPEQRGQGSEFAAQERIAERSVAIAQRWLQTQASRAPKTPQFLWLHLFDAHAPYAAPGGNPKASARDRYMEEILYMGRTLEPFLRYLEQRGRPFVLIGVSDHGEGLGDHGELDHGLQLFDSTLMVPMFWYAPGLIAPRHIAQVARLVDVAPTIYAILGIRSAAKMDGVSLLPLLQGQTLTLPAAYAETFYGHYAYGAQPLRALREGEFKAISSENEVALYRIASDPQEQNDLAATHATRAAGMQLDAWQRQRVDGDAKVDAAVLARLQTLGYVAKGSAAAATESGSNGRARHPKHYAASHRRLVELQNVVAEGNYPRALNLAEALTRDEPRNAFAHYVLGAILLDQKQWARAKTALLAALAIDPSNAQTHFKLGDVYMQQRQFVAAAGHWQAVQTIDPDRVAAWNNHATALALAQRWSDALAPTKQALRREPADETALDNLTQISMRLQRFDELVEAYEKLTRAPGDNARWHLAHGIALVHAKRYDEALRALNRVNSKSPQYLSANVVTALIYARTKEETKARQLLSKLSQAPGANLIEALKPWPELAPLAASVMAR